jgi:hypothetical protein
MIELSIDWRESNPLTTLYVKKLLKYIVKL